MAKKISLLLCLLFVFSCSPKYYKSRKGNTEKVTYETKKKHRKEVINTKKSSQQDDDDEDEYLVATSAVEVTPAVIRQYIEDYKDISMVEMQRYKIPASITLAQAILESGSGQGRLARLGITTLALSAIMNGKEKPFRTMMMKKMNVSAATNTQTNRLKTIPSFWQTEVVTLLYLN